MASSVAALISSSSSQQTNMGIIIVPEYKKITGKGIKTMAFANGGMILNWVVKAQ